MSFWGSLNKWGHSVSKKIEQTTKHVANDFKKVEKTIQQAEKKAESVTKQIVKDTIQISQKAKEAFQRAEKQIEKAGKHIANDVKKAEKAVHQTINHVEKKVEQITKQALEDTVHISHKAQTAFREAEKKTEQMTKQIVHHAKKTTSETVHSVKQTLKDTEKAMERGTHQLEKKAGLAVKQSAHDIMNIGQRAEKTVLSVAKRTEQSWHNFKKHPMESTKEFVTGAGDAALSDMTLNVVQKRSDYRKHPTAYKAGQVFGHAVATIAGVMETTGSVAIGTGGMVLNATGIGAVIGTPATAIAAAGVTHGATLTATGSTNFAKSAKELYQRMSRSEGSSGGVSKGNVKHTGKSQLEQNKAKGDAFEKEVVNKISSDPNNINVRQQITVKTKSGVRTRIDIVSKNSQTGQIQCVECKASPTAPLTKNQKKAFPEIEQSGATVVGKGKAPYTGGTKIPPTKVEIIRKK